jgi:NAD+ diphosphatase
VMEEVGLSVSNLRYFGSQPWPFPSNLMVGFIAEYQITLSHKHVL